MNRAREAVTDLTAKRLEAVGFGDMFDAITDDFVQMPTPPERPPLVDKFLPRGKPGVFAAMGAGGKTTSVAELAFKMAYPMEGDTWMGQPIDASEGRTVFVTREDSMEDIHWLAHDLRIPERQKAWRAAHGNETRIKFITAENSQHVIEMDNGKLATTPFFDNLTERCIAWRPRLVVFDTASKTMRINLDSSSSETGGAADIMTDFSIATGATSLTLHHVTKEGAEETRSKRAFRKSIKGSGSFVDGFRFALGMWEPWQGIVQAMIENEIVDQEDAHRLVALCLVKNNVRELQGRNLPHIIMRGKRIGDDATDLTAKCRNRIEGFDLLLDGKDFKRPSSDDKASPAPSGTRPRGRPPGAKNRPK